MLLKVGLTGGIGCGKSTAVDAFRVLGIPIIDADQIAKDIVKPGQGALIEIKKEFGDKVILENGELNRALLKKKVFSNAKALENLEKILHPRIREEIQYQLSQINNKPYVIVDVPLLVEKKYQALFDRIIVVDCLPEQQLERVIQRDGVTETDVKKIIQQQATRAQRLTFASDILDNSAGKDDLLSQINILHSELVSLS